MKPVPPWHAVLGLQVADKRALAPRTVDPRPVRTPACICWISAVDSANQRTRVLGTVTFGDQVLVTRPAFEWLRDTEHLFVPAAVTDLDVVLSRTSRLEIELVHRSPASPDSAVRTFAQELVAGHARFQGYADAVLSGGDWEPGLPLHGPRSHHFVQAGDSARRARLLLDVDPERPGELTKLVRMTQEKHLGDHFGQAEDGAIIVLERAPLAAIPIDVYRHDTWHP
jgi:hypothetical protein